MTDLYWLCAGLEKAWRVTDGARSYGEFDHLFVAVFCARMLNLGAAPSCVQVQS